MLLMSLERSQNGRIRGIVTGDTFRREVARTMAQRSKKFEEACIAIQDALASGDRLRCSGGQVHRGTGSLEDFVVHWIGAFNHIKRKSMLRMIYGKDCTYVWYDDEGAPHEILEGEGGEQGDALMPALYALGQHEALSQVHATPRQGEMLFAYLDDIYVLCTLLELQRFSPEVVGRQRGVTCAVSQ